MTEVLGSEMKSVIRPLPKFSPDYKPGAAPPHTENRSVRGPHEEGPWNIINSVTHSEVQ